MATYSVDQDVSGLYWARVVVDENTTTFFQFKEYPSNEIIDQLLVDYINARRKPPAEEVVEPIEE